MLLPEGLTLSTTDAAEGKEYKFVILDLVTPGGKRYPLRSVADIHKMCVGSSRAQIGLLIVGSEDMYLSQPVDNGSKSWKWLIEEDKRNNALVRRELTVEAINELCAHIQFPGQLYEAVPIRVGGERRFWLRGCST